ncbi:TetR/AcrR family transcriptional regulator [Bifidobacterium sp. UBA744]|uniref:TetR/AcrR family transcriptional regulator n=1 Tax=Bifidobacterium sp. UBA744 TaxID=1946112 RepID=UPI0025BFA267|nr:TetR/AcrR family transcriptional regulator [Bifidobacterium sp. UBA744]
MARKRNTGTEAKIKEAFTALLREKGFDAMTVSDIARTAGINRGTFYMHYMDKFDLRQQLIDNATMDLRDILTPPAIASHATQPDRHVSTLDVIAPQAILRALQYVKNDAAFFDAISQSGQDMRMYDETKTILKKMLEDNAARMRVKPTLGGLPATYGYEIVVSSVTSIIWLWIRRGFLETPEAITKYIELNKRLSPVALLR